MVRSIATGSNDSRPRARGFTLIELLVVMSIIATLLMIAVPRYFHSLERSREAVLRQDLAVMRDAIDKFYGDLARYPDSLTELAERSYIRGIPVDPLTKSAETWILVPSEDDTITGARDVHSGAEGMASDGTLFTEW